MESVSEKKSGGHRTSKIVKSRQSPIIVHFITWCARSIHDVACEFARAVVRSKDAEKQLARTDRAEKRLRMRHLRPSWRQNVDSSNKFLT